MECMVLATQKPKCLDCQEFDFPKWQTTVDNVQSKIDIILSWILCSCMPENVSVYIKQAGACTHFIVLTHFLNAFHKYCKLLIFLRDRSSWTTKCDILNILMRWKTRLTMIISAMWDRAECPWKWEWMEDPLPHKMSSQTKIPKHVGKTNPKKFSQQNQQSRDRVTPPKNFFSSIGESKINFTKSSSMSSVAT